MASLYCLIIFPFKSASTKSATFFMLLQLSFLIAAVQARTHLYLDYYSQGYNSHADVLLLAFADIDQDGKLYMSSAVDNISFVKQLKRNGKQVYLSVGGIRSFWPYALSSPQRQSAFIQSILSAVSNLGVSGIDLNVLNYRVPPAIFSEFIAKLGKQLKDRSVGLSLTTEPVTVCQNVSVPSPDQPNVNAFNYMVHIINRSDQYIDFYQVMTYNNWYHGYAPGSQDLLLDIYLNWRNLPGLCPECSKINNFKGVAQQKLMLLVPASPQAVTKDFYIPPQQLKEALERIREKGGVLGLSVWQNHWDEQNGRVISDLEWDNWSSLILCYWLSLLFF